MAKRIRPADLTCVPCACVPGLVLPDGTPAEWHETPGAAALAVRRHVERVDGGGSPYWAVHWSGAPDPAEAHVVSAVIHGLRYGPHAPGRGA